MKEFFRTTPYVSLSEVQRLRQVLVVGDLSNNASIVALSFTYSSSIQLSCMSVVSLLAVGCFKNLDACFDVTSANIFNGFIK